ncbi:MAG: restriction endonuclease subunit S [Verrucomicrobia bacterium]|nr:restriction endonuclease subunit S [Verrucomicrobiota bacterium]MBU1734015.1 restriction endonuclease subunit S [Verrucomicrobiota bacterium]MBU1857111.1 restriction endonuclease subunit S [Verrucomicrobiota bacterium]
MTLIEETKALAPWAERLPADWRATRLDAIADVLFSNVDKHTIEGEQTVRLCNYVDVYKNERITGKLDFMEATAEPREVKKFQIRRGDVLATKDSEEPDDIAIPSLVTEDIPDVLCGYHLAMIRPRYKNAHGPFIAWTHASKQFRAQYEAKAVGVTRFGLSQYAFRAARFPLPPLLEQQRIAAYLDASCAAIDAAVAAKQRQIETLDSLRKTIIAQVVTKGLNGEAELRDSGVQWFGQIPKHWRCEHLKRFTTRIQTGCTPPTDTPDYYFDGTIPWFAPGSYDGNIELREARKLINELARREGVLRMFPTETVFLVGIGATIGKVGLIRQEAACNQQIIGIVSTHRMIGRYLAYQFKIYEDVIPGIASATTLPIFDQVKTGYLPTLQPPSAEQEAICTFLDEKLAELKCLVAGIETQIATLVAYRKSLIHECVTGQRRITDADIQRAGG